jgi:acyl carrier protein
MITFEPTTRARVVATIAEILEIDPSRVAGAQRLREDLGMDSLGSLELLSTISEALRIDLEMEDAMGIVTVDDACAFVERHRAEGRARANGA